MSVREEHQENASSPMLVTLSGIVTLVREKQFSKASSPMLVTLSGIVMSVREEHQENARSPMLVTPFGIVIDLIPSSFTPVMVFPFLLTINPALSAALRSAAFFPSPQPLSVSARARQIAGNIKSFRIFIVFHLVFCC